MKPFRLRTKEELKELKKSQCVKCAYFMGGKSLDWDKRTCGYINYMGHCRGCDPFECVEKGIFKEKKRIRKTRAISIRKGEK